MSKSEMLNSIISYYTSNSNKSEFARILGLSPQTISSWITRGSFDLELVYSKCIGLNPHWLLTGEGEMILPPSQTLEASANVSHQAIESLSNALNEANRTISFLRDTITEMRKERDLEREMMGLLAGDAENDTIVNAQIG